MADVDREAWDRLATGSSSAYYPFAAYDFLDALERSGSVRPEVGWGPHHLLLEQNGELRAAMPLYLKGNSFGEYIFDQNWAHAYQRAGGQYYPKLLGAIPFTPTQGPRLLAEHLSDRDALVRAATSEVVFHGLSSLHINFLHTADCDTLEQAGYLIRHGQQYRFVDEGFGDWQGFLSALASRKRKALKKERASIPAAGIEIDWVTGKDITEVDLDQFWVFYQNTGARKWGTPYLTRAFFSLLVERMAEHVLFFFARRHGETIAGAMSLIGGDTLYGRYWGCTEYVPFLHFELCYYQSIDWALAHGKRYVDGGAQGEHKIARGYRPTTTRSAHFIRDPAFREAVARFVEAERNHVADEISILSTYQPFKNLPTGEVTKK
ncbi:MAG: GNAT family N-acetyltransferase [Parvularcula sp.]